MTNHGPRGFKDATPYNHYSLLRTIEQSLGLACLEFTCDTANVQPLAPLFKVTGAIPVRTTPASEPNFATPSPMPTEPITYTAHTDTSADWSVVPASARDR